MPQPTSGVITRRHVSVAFKDGAGSPLSRTLGPGIGDFTWDGVQEANKEATPVYDRGSFLELVYGDDSKIDVAGTVFVVGDNTGASIADALLKTGDFASATTTDSGGLVWSGTVVITETRSTVTNTHTFAKCRGSLSWKEDAGGNTYALKFACYGGYTAG